MISTAIAVNVYLILHSVLFHHLNLEGKKLVDIKEFLKQEEGWFGPDKDTSYVYRDSLGYWTSGWGHQESDIFTNHIVMRAEVRSVWRWIWVSPEYVVLTKTAEQCELELDREIKHFTDQITKTFPNIRGNRRSALIMMAYQMGMTGLMGFTNMCVELLKYRVDYQKVHDHALDSKWAKQTPERAERVAALFLED